MLSAGWRIRLVCCRCQWYCWCALARRAVLHCCGFLGSVLLVLDFQFSRNLHRPRISDGVEPRAGSPASKIVKTCHSRAPRNTAAPQHTVSDPCRSKRRLLNAAPRSTNVRRPADSFRQPLDSASARSDLFQVLFLSLPLSLSLSLPGPCLPAAHLLMLFCNQHSVPTLDACVWCTA